MPRTTELLQRSLQEKWAPGAVAAIWNIFDSQAPWIQAVGDRRVVPSPQPMACETVLDLASLTKPLVTTTLVARAIERGLLDWQTPISAIFGDAPSEWSKIQIWHLLSHTAGFRAWEPFWQKLVEKWGDRLPEVSIRKRQQEMRAQVFCQKPEVEPGFRVLYSDVSFLLLGMILEQVSGERLDRAWNRLGFQACFQPVHRSASLRQPVDDRFGATEESSWRGGVLQGEVHDENCWSMGGIAGHAGLFGSAGDVIEIVNAIFRNELFSEKIAEKVFLRVTPLQGNPRAWGWDIASGEDSSAGTCLGSRHGVVGHLGFTGTSLWVDRQTGWAFLLLTQRVHFGRENVGIRQFRPLFHQAAVADLGIDQISSFERR
jgi:CubicO group peptidase (beta-lactamase class C family)